ncbi:MAG TPA: DUF1735 domain-containing protein [Candidatus Dojkabacteria bacterium]|nr:DUF1735 domain-containing protein [Candidatus Dojkabacteria bacterium]
MKKILILSYVALASIFLSSCLKDELVSDQKYGLINLNANKIIGFNNLIEENALPFENVDRFVEVPVHLSSEDVASEDIHVTLSLANSATLIAAWNTAKKTEYEEFPTSLYTIEGNSLVVTIPKGSKEGKIRFKVNTSFFDTSITYALGLAVTSIDKTGYIISGNYKNIIVTFGAKNKYDGVYEITSGTLVSTNTTLSHVNTFLSTTGEKMQYELRTIAANKCLAYDNFFFGGLYYPIGSSASPFYSRFGGVVLIVEFDPATDKVIGVTNYYKGDATNNPNARDFVLDATGENKWTNGTMKIKYQMTQGGALNSTITEEWTFLEER